MGRGRKRRKLGLWRGLRLQVFGAVTEERDWAEQTFRSERAVSKGEKRYDCSANYPHRITISERFLNDRKSWLLTEIFFWKMHQIHYVFQRYRFSCMASSFTKVYDVLAAGPLEPIWTSKWALNNSTDSLVWNRSDEIVCWCGQLAELGEWRCSRPVRSEDGRALA